MATQERKALIQEIQTKRGNSRLICCLTSDRENAIGFFAKDFIPKFFQHLRATRNLEKLDILLFTLGGETMAAYAASRLLRQFAKTIGVLVPHMCLSAGTLFALGADEIVMTRLATLSSIDPSLNGPWNPSQETPPAPGVPLQRIPVGVESVAGFKKLVQDWHLDKEGTAVAFRLLADKVNPLLLGDLQRGKEQIVRLATNLMKLHSHDAKRITSIVETLATRLGSHDYLIGPVEAREIKLQVAKENEELETLIWSLYEDFAEEMELGIPFIPAQQAQTTAQNKVLKVVMIESLERTDVWERELLIMPNNQVQIIRNGWVEVMV